jgi:hypothetical protein
MVLCVLSSVSLFFSLYVLAPSPTVPHHRPPPPSINSVTHCGGRCVLALRACFLCLFVVSLSCCLPPVAPPPSPSGRDPSCAACTTDHAGEALPTPARRMWWRRHPSIAKQSNPPYNRPRNHTPCEYIHVSVCVYMCVCVCHIWCALSLSLSRPVHAYCGPSPQ